MHDQGATSRSLRQPSCFRPGTDRWKRRGLARAQGGDGEKRRSGERGAQVERKGGGRRRKKAIRFFLDVVASPLARLSSLSTRNNNASPLLLSRQPSSPRSHHLPTQSPTDTHTQTQTRTESPSPSATSKTAPCTSSTTPRRSRPPTAPTASSSSGPSTARRSSTAAKGAPLRWPRSSSRRAGAPTWSLGSTARRRRPCGAAKGSGSGAG